MLLVSFESSHRDDSNEYQQHSNILKLEHIFQVANVLSFMVAK